MRVAPTTDRVLSDFFADRRHGAVGTRRERVDRTECDLRLAVETTAVPLLSADDAVLLGLERDLDPIGAVGRILPVSALPQVLERFVVDPLYRPDARDEARDRLDVCAALLRRLARDPALSTSTRLLRRVDEAIRIEAAALAPRRLPRRARG